MPTPLITFLTPQPEPIVLALQNIALALRVQPFWNTQWFAAMIGAVVGLIPSLYLLYKDRPQIKVKVAHSLISFLSPNTIKNGISINLLNFGQRPIVANSVFFEFVDGTTMVFFDDALFVGGSKLPKIIAGGDSHSVTVLADSLAPELHQKNMFPNAVCYRDAIGNEYRCKIPQEFWNTLFKVAST